MSKHGKKSHKVTGYDSTPSKLPWPPRSPEAQRNWNKNNVAPSKRK